MSIEIIAVLVSVLSLASAVGVVAFRQAKELAYQKRATRLDEREAILDDLYRWLDDNLCACGLVCELHQGGVRHAISLIERRK